MGDVTWILDAKQDKAVRAFMELVEAQKKTEDGARRSGRAHKDMGDTMESTLGKAALGFIGINSALELMHKGIEVATRSLEDMHERERKALETNLTLYQARNAAIMNLPSDMPVQQMDEIARRVSQAARVPEATAYGMMMQGLSAKGDIPAAAFEDALTVAARVSRRTGGRLPAEVLAGGLLDLARVTGLESAEANLGWMTQVGAQMRVTDIGLQMENLLPGIRALQLSGESAESAAEWAALFSSYTMDPTGQKTGTALMGIGRRLAGTEMVPSRAGAAGPLGGRAGKTQWELIPEEYGTMEERLRYLQGIYAQQPREIQAEMVTRFGGREVAKSVAMALLEGREDVWRQHRFIQEQVAAPGAESAAALTGKEAAMRAAPMAAGEEMMRAFELAAEEQSILGVAGARRRITAQGLQEVMQRAGVPWWQRTKAGWEFEAETLAGLDMNAVAARILSEQAVRLRPRRTFFETLALGGEAAMRMGGMAGAGEPLPESSRSFAENADMLQKFADELKRNAEATERVANMLEQAGTGPARNAGME